VELPHFADANSQFPKEPWEYDFDRKMMKLSFNKVSVQRPVAIQDLVAQSQTGCRLCVSFAQHFRSAGGESFNCVADYDDMAKKCDECPVQAT